MSRKIVIEDEIYNDLGVLHIIGSKVIYPNNVIIDIILPSLIVKVLKQEPKMRIIESNINIDGKGILILNEIPFIIKEELLSEDIKFLYVKYSLSYSLNLVFIKNKLLLSLHKVSIKPKSYIIVPLDTNFESLIRFIKDIKWETSFAPENILDKNGLLISDWLDMITPTSIMYSSWETYKSKTFNTINIPNELKVFVQNYDDEEAQFRCEVFIGKCWKSSGLPISIDKIETYLLMGDYGVRVFENNKIIKNTTLPNIIYIEKIGYNKYKLI